MEQERHRQLVGLHFTNEATACGVRLQTLYQDSLAFVNPNKVVEVRMEDKLACRPYKHTSLLKELMTLQVEFEGVMVPVFQAVVPNFSGLNAGTATAALYSNVLPALELVDKMQVAICAWWFNY